MPSSCGPTLAPSPPSWWQLAQLFLNTTAPAFGSGFALPKPSRRWFISSVIRWSADGSPLVNSAIRSPTLGSLLSFRRGLHGPLLQQPGRRLAGRHRLEQVVRPRLAGRPSPWRCSSATGPGPSPGPLSVPHTRPAWPDPASAWAARSRTSIALVRHRLAPCRAAGLLEPGRDARKAANAAPPLSVRPVLLHRELADGVGGALELHRRRQVEARLHDLPVRFLEPRATSPSANACRPGRTGRRPSAAGRAGRRRTGRRSAARRPACGSSRTRRCPLAPSP